MKKHIITAVSTTDLSPLQSHSTGQMGSRGCATLASSSTGRQALLCWDAERALWWSQPQLPPAADSGPLYTDEIFVTETLTTWWEDTEDTHLLSLPSQAEGWAGDSWQSQIWPDVPGSWAGTQTTGRRTPSPPHWPPPPNSTRGQRCPQIRTPRFWEHVGKPERRARNQDRRCSHSVLSHNL